VKRLLTLALAAALIALAGRGAADDPPKTEPEPPVRMQKKKKAPPPAEKTDPDEAKKLRPRDESKPGAKKPDPPDEGDSEDAKILERIAKNSQEAGKRLAGKDAGDDTRKLQDETLRDIDRLLNKLENPPPQASDQSPPDKPMTSNDPSSHPQPKPMAGKSDGSDSQPMPMPGGAGGLGKRSQLPPRPGSGQPQPQPQPMPSPMAGGSKPMPMPTGGSPMPMPMGGSPMPMGGGKEKPMDGDPKDGDPKNPTGGSPKDPPKTGDPGKLADLYKDVWGHLPETMRQQMDAYYQERFMPRYQELLKQYYATVAEKNRRPGERP
jgi:hypothetical protein